MASLSANFLAIVIYYRSRGQAGDLQVLSLPGYSLYSRTYIQVFGRYDQLSLEGYISQLRETPITSERPLNGWTSLTVSVHVSARKSYPTSRICKRKYNLLIDRGSRAPQLGFMFNIEFRLMDLWNAVKCLIIKYSFEPSITG